MAAATNLTPEQRAMRGRLAAHAMHAQGKTNTAPATAASMARFERQVDPEGSLPEAERARRAAQARSAHFTRLAYLSSRARGERASEQRRVA
ncbi:MAG: hypothetical protein M3R38_06910 [Actinomycetota bacterium]|nr:hypothetical protein [Actinomycetota bacterium]